MSPAASMEIYLRSVVFVCSLLSVRGAGDVKNLTFCTDAQIPSTTLCTQEDTVIQVMDVYVYDFTGLEGTKDCAYQHGDYGEPLIDVSSGVFNNIVTRCDGRQACLSLRVPGMELSDGSNSDYIVMNYTCVRNVSTMITYGEVGRTFERTSCGDNAVLHVVGVYAGFSHVDCTRTWRHVDGDYFRIVKSGCEQYNCVGLRSRGYRRRCNNRDVQSFWVAIDYRCNILREEEMTPAVATTPVVTTISVGATKYTAGSLATITSPGDSPRTPADPSTTDVITGGPGIDGQKDTGGEISGGSDVGNEIGLYAGVAMAAVVLITITAVAVVCRTKCRNQIRTTQTQHADDEMSDIGTGEYLDLGSVNTNNVRSATDGDQPYYNVATPGTDRPAASGTHATTHDDVVYEDVTRDQNLDVAAYDNVISDSTNGAVQCDNMPSDTTDYENVNTPLTYDAIAVHHDYLPLFPDATTDENRTTGQSGVPTIGDTLRASDSRPYTDDDYESSAQFEVVSPSEYTALEL